MSTHFYLLPGPYPYKGFTGYRKSYGKLSGSWLPVIYPQNLSTLFIVYMIGIVRCGRRRRRRCHRRLCRQHFQMTSLKLLGKLKPNYIWGLHGVGGVYFFFLHGVGGRVYFFFFFFFHFYFFFFFFFLSFFVSFEIILRPQNNCFTPCWSIVKKKTVAIGVGKDKMNYWPSAAGLGQYFT